MRQLQLFINRVLHLFEIRRINAKQDAVYLTFDDGPESGITEFVLEELGKYQFKATFFCRGDNAEKYPDLLKRITEEGHALGNHTYSHINSFDTPTAEYAADVERANLVLNTKLFRPPWGSITLSAFIKLVKKYKFVYWSLTSGDTGLQSFNKKRAFERITRDTQTGDVVLFHCCQKHAKETKQLLPDYLEWLSAKGYHSEVIK